MTWVPFDETHNQFDSQLVRLIIIIMSFYLWNRVLQILQIPKLNPFMFCHDRFDRITLPTCVVCCVQRAFDMFSGGQIRKREPYTERQSKWARKPFTVRSIRINYRYIRIHICRFEFRIKMKWNEMRTEGKWIRKKYGKKNRKTFLRWNDAYSSIPFIRKCAQKNRQQ